MPEDQQKHPSSDSDFETFLKPDSDTPAQGKGEPHLPWEAGKTLLEDYVIVRQIGQGGMGTVYLVNRNGDDRLFAVKTLISSEQKHTETERTFIRELRTWIDLPDHPHLTACRFFRTIEDRLAIFAEYVDGGSLKHWIRKQRLLSVRRILNIAIQVAWGLQAAHDRGVVHQDVKPANVLMTKSGIAKVTDFGLSRARLTGPSEKSAPGFETEPILVTTAGMTPAYCSPEQFMREKLSLKTDMWSWGVSVLEMFTGQVTWHSGSVASGVLEQYLGEGPSHPFPKMPEGVVDLLRKCFREDPRERWKSMDEITRALGEIYLQDTGLKYPRVQPRVQPLKETEDVTHDRRIYGAFKWKDPGEWLKKAVALSGGDGPKMTFGNSPKKGTLSAQAVDDIEMFEQAVEIFVGLQDKTDLREDFARLLADKASAHVYLNDLPGAVMHFDHSLDIWEQLVFGEGKFQLKPELSRAYGNKAYLLKMLGESRSSEALFRKTIKMQERLVYQDNHRDLTGDLASRYINIANILDDSGRYHEALEFEDKAIVLRKRLAETDADTYTQDLADAYWLKAMSLEGFGKLEQSLKLYDRAISLIKNLLTKGDNPKYRYDLALLYMNKGTVLETRGDYTGGIALLEEATVLIEHLVLKDGRNELRREYAGILINKGLLMTKAVENDDGIVIFNKAIGILERMFDKEGIRQLAGTLAHVYMCKAMAMCNLHRHQDALELCDKTITIYSQRYYDEGRNEYAGELARAYCNKSETLRFVNDHKGAHDLIGKAIALMEKMISDEVREDLSYDLSWLLMIESQILMDLDDYPQAKTSIEKSINLRERLVHVENRDEYRGDLALVRLQKAEILVSLDELAAAKTEADAAIPILESEYQKTKRREFKTHVDDAGKWLSGLTSSSP